MAWQKNGTSTLTGLNSTISLTLTASKKFNQFLQHSIGNSYQNLHKYNNDSGSKYAYRISSNGGVDSTGVSSSHLAINWGNDTDGALIIIYTCSILGQEKLNVAFGAKTYIAGAGTAPERCEHVGKYVPSPDADITSISVSNGLGSYATDSNLSALGTD